MAIIFLVLSIVFSTFINLVFKWFSVFEVNKIQAILVNYLVCFIIGFILSRDHDVLKAKFEAQSKHLQDLQLLLTPRLTHSDPIGHRAARYLGEIARAFKGDKN